MIVCRLFELGLSCCECLGRDGAVGAEKAGQNDRDGPFEESGVVVNEVCEAIRVDGSVDLLDDCSLNQVAGLEVVQLRIVGSGYGCNDGCGAVGHVGHDGEDGSHELDSLGHTLVGCYAADEPKVTLDASTEGGAHRFCICFALFFKLGETSVSRIVGDLRQRRMLEVVLTVVYL